MLMTRHFPDLDTTSVFRVISMEFLRLLLRRHFAGKRRLFFQAMQDCMPQNELAF